MQSNTIKLKKIKLAGFKSFVDLTEVLLPSSLVAVVGPNGCGKSNVIDAVRWVMGESSAKYLRGESMEDVIFNGSSARKPVSQATVELLFDNTNQALGGEFAQFSEISIRRQVTRDGQSNYFLNGTRCRRKDITDLFLGTGLGPRSYSIIEQGTVSRLIEAKPEELRLYLEEAAGISKYKERRRETENRIQQTRENLDRLNDVRNELMQQLERLDKQAETAKRYQALKQQEQIQTGELTAIRWRGLHTQSMELNTNLQQEILAVEAMQTSLQTADTDFEKQQILRMESQESFNKIQTEHYAINAEIGRLEQSIQHQRERQQQLTNDKHQVDQLLSEQQRLLSQDEAQFTQLSAELTQHEPSLITAQATAADGHEKLAHAEQQLQAWQNRWDDFNQQAAQATQVAQIEQTRMRHLEQNMSSLQQQMVRLQDEQGSLVSEPLVQTLEELASQLQTREAHQKQIEQLLEQITTEMNQLRQTLSERKKQLDEANKNLQQRQGRRASLETLQETALGKQSGSAVTAWLKKYQLHEQPRLAEVIQVQPGWERAVEIVFGPHLEAVCVDDYADFLVDIDPAEQQGLVFFKKKVTTPPSSGAQRRMRGEFLLENKIICEWFLQPLIAGIHVAETLTQALHLLPTLQSHESVITQEGKWLSQHWLRIGHVGQTQNKRVGVLERERELRELHDQIAMESQKIQDLKIQVTQIEQQLNTFEQQRDGYQTTLNQLHQQCSSLSAQQQVKQSQLEQIEKRRQVIALELTTLEQSRVNDQIQLEQAKHAWNNALQSTEQHSQLRTKLLAEKDQVMQAVNDHREQSKQLQQMVHEAAMRLQSLRTQHQAAQLNIQRLQTQLIQLKNQQETLISTLLTCDQPLIVAQQNLAAALQQRLVSETAVTTARESLAHCEQLINELLKKRQDIEQQLDVARRRLEEKRLRIQEVEVRSKTLEEQLQAMNLSLSTILENLSTDATEIIWQQKIEKIISKITKLGAINLAAIEEHATQSERKQYLDQQHQDITEALLMLEQAIQKIDRETRARFKETYDKVNKQFELLFPRVFGGGEASLVLSGDDLLSTGVSVMARPPGKRNSTIHLLSGGEKALTAIALVFAIFHLNPAPFCMLDEVDAPLDDANVGRFCSLVKEMSVQTQFIFITHNKLTMEISNHLIGVTMNEPGVSRLVSVDVAEAVALALPH